MKKMRQIAPSSRTEARCGLVYQLVAGLGYSSASKMEAVRSSETSLNIYQTIRSHIPRGRHRGNTIIASSDRLTYRNVYVVRQDTDTRAGTWVDYPCCRGSWLRIIDPKGEVRRSSVSSCGLFRLFPTFWCSRNM
jgi:hypothetical protein